MLELSDFSIPFLDPSTTRSGESSGVRAGLPLLEGVGTAGSVPGPPECRSWFSCQSTRLAVTETSTRSIFALDGTSIGWATPSRGVGVVTRGTTIRSISAS